MYRIITAALITLLAVPAFAADEPKTEEQKTIYAIGVALARQISVFDLTPAEFALVQQGLADSAPGKLPCLAKKASARV